MRKARVTGYADDNRGVWVELERQRGFIPLHELSWRRVRSPQEVYQIGDLIEVVVDRHTHDGFVGSVRKAQPTEDPLTNGMIGVGSVLAGTVTRVEDVLEYGSRDERATTTRKVALVELPYGQLGLLKVKESSDISVGLEIRVRVSRVDLQRRTIELDSHHC